MANPKPTSSGPSPTQASSVTKSDSSGIGTTVFSTHQQKIITTSHTTMGTVFSPTTPHGVFSQAGTPSDTTSSLSSFTSTGQQMLSPESADSVVLTMSPIETGRIGIFGKTSTFKAQNRKSMDVEKISSFVGGNLNGGLSCNNINNNNESNGRIRPTPPSTLNLGPLRIPPAPPPRWAKPTTPTSPTDTTPTDGQLTNNFTVTTTVTFSVEGNQNSQIVEVMSPNANTTVNARFMILATIQPICTLGKQKLTNISIVLVPNNLKATVAGRRMQDIRRYAIISGFEAMAKPIQQGLQSEQSQDFVTQFGGYPKRSYEAQPITQRVKTLPGTEY